MLRGLVVMVTKVNMWLKLWNDRGHAVVTQLETGSKPPCEGLMLCRPTHPPFFSQQNYSAVDRPCQQKHMSFLRALSEKTDADVVKSTLYRYMLHQILWKSIKFHKWSISQWLDYIILVIHFALFILQYWTKPNKCRNTLTRWTTPSTPVLWNDVHVYHCFDSHLH